MIKISNEEVKKYLVYSEEQAKNMLGNLGIIGKELPNNWQENLNSALLCMYRNSENRRNIALFILHLKFVEGCNNTEIAEKLGVTKVEASDLMNRAELTLSHYSNKAIILYGPNEHELLKRMRKDRVYGTNEYNRIANKIKRGSVVDVMNRLGVFDKQVLEREVYSKIRIMNAKEFIELNQLDLLQFVTETRGLSVAAYKRLMVLQKKLKIAMKGED